MIDPKFAISTQDGRPCVNPLMPFLHPWKLVQHKNRRLFAHNGQYIPPIQHPQMSSHVAIYIPILRLRDASREFPASVGFRFGRMGDFVEARACLFC